MMTTDQPTPEQLRREIVELNLYQNQCVTRIGFALVDTICLVCIYLLFIYVLNTTFGFDNLLIYFAGLVGWRGAMYYWAEGSRQRASLTLARLRRDHPTMQPKNCRHA